MLWQSHLIEIAYAKGALQFGSFTLKSGRISPYFFNLGKLADGESQNVLARLLADKINSKINSGLSVDLLFGPAYKGIPLVTATAILLQQEYGINLNFSYNRKESKTHGEGGNIIGSEIKGDVLILDDVITAGTAIKESINIINNANAARVTAICTVIDRQEKTNHQSTIDALKSDYGLQIFSLLKFDDIYSWLEQQSNFSQYLQPMLEYRKLYGSK